VVLTNPTAKRPRKSSWPGISKAGAIAKAILAAPPADALIERPAIVGSFVWGCVVPAELCLPTNQFKRTNRWACEKTYNRILEVMRQQLDFHVRDKPLPGRPRVHVVRLTSKAPDVTADWSKFPVDAIVKPMCQRSRKDGRIIRQRDGLGFLRDDNRRDSDIRTWWEPAPRGVGIVVLEIWTGTAPDVARR